MMREFPFYLVSTPIGNLSDLSRRAVDVLGSVDFILTEDSRKTRRLLDAYGLDAATVPYHDHNKEKVTPSVLDRLERGETGALVTDAGTPGISDPGFRAVRAAREAGFAVEVLPGATALIPALVASGLPSDRFVFEGFLPRKAGARRRLFEALEGETRSVLYYESPYRFFKNLELIQ